VSNEQYVMPDEFISLAGGAWQAGDVVFGWPVGAAARIVGFFLLYESRLGSGRRIGRARLAKAARLAPSTVQAALRDLQDRGLLAVGPDRQWRFRRPSAGPARGSARARPDRLPASPPAAPCPRELTGRPSVETPSRPLPKESSVSGAEAEAIATRQASGDTELVYGLCQLLGGGRIDHATWCMLDRLAIGKRTVCHGDRARATAYLLGIARSVAGDAAVKNKVATFLGKVRDAGRFPSLAAAWVRRQDDG